jgi:hypothetical protein
MSKHEEKYRDALIRIKEKSEDDFEKNITYISAGGLALSLTLIDKIVNLGNSIYKPILIISWTLFTISLLTNLISHYISSYYHDKSINEIDKKNPDILENIDRRNQILRIINITNVVLLILGIAFLVVFTSINI